MLYFNIKFIDHFMSLFFIFVFYVLDILVICTKIMFSSTDKTFNVRLSKSGHESAKNEAVNV